VVNITTSAPVVTVPATMRIAGGSTATSFSIATRAVAAETSVTIHAASGAETRTATLLVQPPAAPVLELQVDPSFEGGASSVATVRLDKAASPPAPIVVRLTSNNAALAVPESAIVPAGFTTTTFTMTSRVVAVETRVTVSASFGGQTRTAETLIRPR
jgi:hypothetical protein